MIFVHASVLHVTSQLQSWQERDGIFKQVIKENLIGLFIEVWEGLKETSKGVVENRERTRSLK